MYHNRWVNTRITNCNCSQEAYSIHVHIHIKIIEHTSWGKPFITTLTTYMYDGPWYNELTHIYPIHVRPYIELTYQLGQAFTATSTTYDGPWYYELTHIVNTDGQKEV